MLEYDDDDCFHYHSRIHNVVIAFRTSSSFLTSLHIVSISMAAVKIPESGAPTNVACHMCQQVHFKGNVGGCTLDALHISEGVEAPFSSSGGSNNSPKLDTAIYHSPTGHI